MGESSNIPHLIFIDTSMHYNYLKDKSREFISTIWDIVEDVQSTKPHFLVGWDGFMPILIDPTGVLVDKNLKLFPPHHFNRSP